jgi:putative hydroxymethylpyrimidine transport system ATP-binding protein
VSPGLAIRGLASRYGGGDVFADVNFDVPAGALVALLGPSGVGKTTLLRILAGLATPAAGGVAATDGAKLDRRIAYMAQQDLLLPWASARENVVLGARLRGGPADEARAEQMLHRVGLGSRAHALPAELSGGERQRVALARTLYENRPVVLLDEPFSALDALTRIKMQTLAATLLAGRTVLFITHDPLEACRLGQHVLVLSGTPPRMGPPLSLPGTTPRAVDDPAVLATQAALLRQLAA